MAHSPARSRWWSTRFVRRFLLVTAAVAVILLAACCPAFADEDEAPAAAPATSNAGSTHWYGWQTLAADGVSFVGLPLLAASTSAHEGVSVSLLVLAAGGYVLVPPIVHIVHRRGGAAAGSVAMRVGLPVVGILGGTAVTGGCTRELCGMVLAIGAVVGVASAVVLDAAALSWEHIDDDEASSKRASRQRPRLAPQKPLAFTPTFGPRNEGGFDVGVVGSF